MPRLRRADPAAPGFTRRRRGRGFSYLDADGSPIDDPETLERIRALVIPPAWKDVWISPDPLGHLQATGVDSRGRRQYRYHDLWHEQRARQKFSVMEEFAQALPALREAIDEDLSRPGLERERVLACAARLLDRGFFRIGSDTYLESNGSYGLTTIERAHVAVKGDGGMTFDYIAKGGERRRVLVRDEVACEIVSALRRRRSGPETLLCCKAGSRWRRLEAEDVNAYLKDRSGVAEASAKVFRTWHGTVLAALALAVSAPAAAAGSARARSRAEARAVGEVAAYLGNTPAVCRSAYIDPRVLDRWRSGLTIAGVLDQLAREGKEPNGDPLTHGIVERGVLDLLQRREGSPALERARDFP
jgi:DNA topoisomerase IB